MWFREENCQDLVPRSGCIQGCDSFPNHAWCSAIFPLICLTFYFQRDEQASFSSCSWKYEMYQPIISLSPSSTPKTWLAHKFPQRDASVCSVFDLFFCLMSSSDRKVIFDCHGNTLNSSPIYSYTNYKDAVHDL